MTDNEVKSQMKRVVRYRELENVANEIRAAIKAITGPSETGPCGQGPFTGNTRESRQVVSMVIRFSKTRGGAPAVESAINGLNIEAWDLGRALAEMLQVKLKIITEAMEQL